MADAPVYSVQMHDTITGALISKVFPSSGTWGTSITSPGSGSHVFPLGDRAFTRDEWHQLTQPWATTLVHCWGGVAQYAGLVLRRAYDRSMQTLSVDSAEWRTIMSRRFPFQVGPPGSRFVPTGSFVISNKSFPAAVGDVFASITSGAGFTMPMTLPASAAGSVSFTWENYKFQTGEDMLSDLQALDGGPDVHVTPSVATGSLVWNVRAGTPRLTGPSAEWSVTAAAPSAVDVKVTDDGSKELTGVFMVGDGSEQLITVGGANNAVGPTIPFMDAYRSHKGTSDVGQLESFAAAELATFRGTTTQTDFSILASQTPEFGSLVPGSRVRLWWQGDPYIADSSQDLYVLGISGDMTDKVKLAVQAV